MVPLQAQNSPPVIQDLNQDPVLEQLPDPVVESKPLPMIDESLAGWGDANPQDGNRIRANWVMIGDNGSIPGTVTGASINEVSGMEVYLLRDGFVKSQTKTDNRGNFELKGLSEGLYSIVGYSPSAFFAYAFNAIEFRSSAPQMPRRIATQAVGSRGNKLRVSELIEQHSPSVQFRSFGKYSFGELDPGNAAHFGWKGLGDYDVPAIPATTIQSRSINLRTNGRFRGRVHQIHNLNGRPVAIERTQLMLIQNGQTVAQTACNRKGVFEFSGVPSGNFGLVAFGVDGFAAIGVSLVGGSGQRAAGTNGPRSAAKRYRYSFDHVDTAQAGLVATATLDLTLVQPESVGWINHYVSESQFAEVLAQPRQRLGNQCGLCQQPFYGSRPSCGCYRN